MLRIGLKDSSFTRISAEPAGGKRFRRTNGVWPMASNTLLQIFARRDIGGHLLLKRELTEVKRNIMEESCQLSLTRGR
jgi:hypothetical protein